MQIAQTLLVRASTWQKLLIYGGLLVACPTVLYIFNHWKKKRRNLPPGPCGLPYFGSSVFELSESSLAADFERLRQKYGDVVCLWMGGDRYTVILSGYDTIKDAFSSSQATELTDRIPGKFLNGFPIEDTLLNCHCDERHTNSRKIITTFFRHFVAVKLEKVVFSELQKVSEDLERREKKGKGDEVFLAQYLQYVLANVVCCFLFGETYELDDPVLRMIISQSEVSTLAEQEYFMPTILGKPVTTESNKKYSKVKEEMRELRKHIIKKINLHLLRILSVQKEEVEDAIDAYLKEGCLEAYGMDLLTDTILALVPDGIHTANSALSVLLTHYVNSTQYQPQISAEIQSVINKDEAKSFSTDTLKQERVLLSDKEHMPFTQAFMMETLRTNPIFQFSSPNDISQDTQFMGYTLPKNAVLVASYISVQKDPTLFPDPQHFKPERFIKNSKFVSLPGLVPFGMGKRMCIASQLMKSELFLLFTNIVLSYELCAMSSEVEINMSRDESLTFMKFSRELPILFKKRQNGMIL